MEVMHNEEGKAFVPASDFYKKFIYESLKYATQLGKEKYQEHQVDLYMRLRYSDCFMVLEQPFVDEALKVTSTPYEQMWEYYRSEDDDVEKAIHDANIRAFIDDADIDNKPNLRLVK